MRVERYIREVEAEPLEAVEEVACGDVVAVRVVGPSVETVRRYAAGVVAVRAVWGSVYICGPRGLYTAAVSCRVRVDAQRVVECETEGGFGVAYQLGGVAYRGRADAALAALSLAVGRGEFMPGGSAGRRSWVMCRLSPFVYAVGRCPGGFEVRGWKRAVPDDAAWTLYRRLYED